MYFYAELFCSFLYATKRFRALRVGNILHLIESSQCVTDVARIG